MNSVDLILCCFFKFQIANTWWVDSGRIVLRLCRRDLLISFWIWFFCHLLVVSCGYYLVDMLSCSFIFFSCGFGRCTSDSL
jgi:uncharacterized membrane protein